MSLLTVPGRPEPFANPGPHLAPDQIGDALAAAKAIGDDESRSQALAALAPHLAPEQLGEALDAAKAIGAQPPCSGRAAPSRAGAARRGARRRQGHTAMILPLTALAALAPRLAPAQVDEALAAVKAIATSDDRHKALAALAPHLAPEQIERGARRRQGDRDEECRYRLWPRWPPISRRRWRGARCRQGLGTSVTLSRIPRRRSLRLR